MNTNIKNRDEIEEQFKWNLSTMYKSVEEVKQDMKKIRDLLNQFKGYQGKLTSIKKHFWRPCSTGTQY